MVLQVGKPFGRVGFACKPCLRRFISLFTSVCKLCIKDSQRRWGPHPPPTKRGHDSKGLFITQQHDGESQGFAATKTHRRFAEMGDGCRRSRVVGLAYGPPGTRKTASAEQYAQWSLFKPFLPEPLLTFSGRNALDGLSPSRPLAFSSAPLDVPLQECRTVFSTPPVSASAARIEKEVLISFAAVSYLVEAANQLHQRTDAFLVTRRFSRHIEPFSDACHAPGS